MFCELTFIIKDVASLASSRLQVGSAKVVATALKGSTLLERPIVGQISPPSMLLFHAWWSLLARDWHEDWAAMVIADLSQIVIFGAETNE
jgi:hypothetical protein